MEDIRDIIFKEIRRRRYRAVLTAERDGLLSGVEDAARTAAELGVRWSCGLPEGGRLERGVPFAELTASPTQMAMAEERVIGTLAKASGIATSAAEAVRAAEGRVRIVSGSWKKMPPQLKDMVRRAIATGGASFRICEQPMVYIDKNFIRMLGSIPAALEAASALEGAARIIQIKGEACSVDTETRQAVQGGADILMVDTGRRADLEACLEALRQMGARERVQVAFAGGVRIADIRPLSSCGVEMLCIGKEIVDAGLLDMKLDVVEECGI